MANIPSLSLTSAFRTSTDSRINTQRSNIRSAVNNLISVEEQLASGYRVNRPSDDPLAAARSLVFRKEIEQGDQYLRNISIAQAELEITEDSLATMSDLVIRAREIYLASQNAVTSDARSNAAIEIDRLLKEAVNVANREYQGRYIFGGRDGSLPPAQMVGNFVNFVGADEAAEVTIALGESMARNMTGLESFGSISSEIIGTADLDPQLTLATKLSDLNGGEGVQAGSIKIANGTGLTRTLDLSGAETIGDVINIINNDGTVTARIASVAQSDNNVGRALVLVDASATPSITVTEVNNGTTARDLGIQQLSAGTSNGKLTGSDINPQVTGLTQLSDLHLGDGVDKTGFKIYNAGTSLTLDFTSATTVEDLVNQINLSNIYVRAEISEDGSKINLRSSLSGSDFWIEENGGTTARDLGLLVPFEDVALGRLNNGNGVRVIAGDDIRITTRSGATIDVNLSSARTVGEVIAAINNDSENSGRITASIVPGSNQLRLTDSAGGAGNLSVSALNASLAASDLGVLTSIASDVLTGTNLNPVGENLANTFLTQLNNGVGIQTKNGDDFQITLKDGNSFTVDVSNAKTVQDVLDAINNAPGNPGGGALVATIPASSDRIVLNDSTGGSGDLTVTPVNGSLAPQMLGILKSVPHPTAQLSGNDLNPSGHRTGSIFDTFILIKEALNDPDSEILDFLGRELDEVESRLIDSRAEIGVRVNRLEFTTRRLEDQKVRFQTLLSEEREVDLAEAVVEFERNRALLEATYSVTAQVIQLSLLDFIR